MTNQIKWCILILEGNKVYIEVFKMYDFLLTKEAAKLLKVSEEYIRELIRRRQLRAFKVNRRSGYRISKKDFEDFIESKYEKMELEEMGERK